MPSMMTAKADELAVSKLVTVRGQRWVVSDIEPAGQCTLVTLQSVEDGRYGHTLDVIWEVEPGRQVLPSGSLPRGHRRRVRLAGAAGGVPRRGPLGGRHLGRRQDPAGAVPLRRRDRGLPARPGRPGRRRAAGQPAARRRRRPGQDHRGRAGRPGAAAAPPRPPHHDRLPGRPDAEVAGRDGRQVRPRLQHRRLRALRRRCAAATARAANPFEVYPLSDRQPAVAARPEGPAAARRGAARRRPDATRAPSTC